MGVVLMASAKYKYRGPQITTSMREKILGRDDETCRYCCFPAVEVDHVIPRLAGGPTSEDNLVASCRSCNAIAGGLLFESFAEKRDYILRHRRPQIVGRRQANVLRGHVRYQRMLDDGRFDDGQLDMLEEIGYPPLTYQQKLALRRARQELRIRQEAL